VVGCGWLWLAVAGCGWLWVVVVGGGGEVEVEWRWSTGGEAWRGGGVGRGTAQIDIIEKRSARSGVEWNGKTWNGKVGTNVQWSQVE
jgi:hypothetical protein